MTAEPYPRLRTLHSPRASPPGGNPRYAVIIDEAHSSQGGDSAVRLKQALGANAVPQEEDEDYAEYLTRVRGRQSNLSYFAFTATPKSPTLELFGRWDPDKIYERTGEPGMYVPFHVYSMRQAIEERYILDVLANYITYETKWRLRNAAVDQAASPGELLARSSHRGSRTTKRSSGAGDGPDARGTAGR